MNSRYSTRDGNRTTFARHHFNTRPVLTITLLLVALLVISGCSGTLDTPPSTDTPTETATVAAPDTVADESPTDQVDSVSAEAAPTEAEALSMQRFDTQEETFLEQLEQEAANAGEELLSRQYVEHEAAAGALWQGERHQYADHTTYYLQQARSDGLTAMHVEGASSLDALPPDILTGPTETGLEPNVEVQHVEAVRDDDGQWTFSVTLQHPDTGWEDYTDGWQVESMEGEILGVRILLHPHVNEQPFTRSLSGVRVPEESATVRIRAHDLVSGYGPGFIEIPVAESGSGERYTVRR